MRGKVEKQGTMLSLITPEQRVPKDHPLRTVKSLADAALKELSPQFDAMYATTGRHSIPPERLLKAMLLIALYSIRSERMFCEQLHYNLMFRWFVDMDMVEESWNHSTFSKNRDRLMEHEVAHRFLVEIVEQARKARLMSREHFTVDGTLIEAWASMKSFKTKDRDGNEAPPDDPGNPTVDFRGQKRSNATHESTTDSEARLARKGKGKESKLAYSGNVLMENRNGLIVDFLVVEATGKAERESAAIMLDNLGGEGRITLAGDKGYDTKNFVDECRERNVTPHVAQKQHSAVDERTTRHDGYRVSQRVRKRVEEIFGWMKTVGGFRRTRFRGKRRTQFAAYLVAAAYNLLRMARLEPMAA